MNYVPKIRDLTVVKRDIVVVPRWSIDFDSSNTVYKREVLACSGTVLEDTMKYCPRHWKIGAFSLSSKMTVAVCEICGTTLCENHVSPCPICGRWLCEDDGSLCSVCGRTYCKEHLATTCSICGSKICASCTFVCPGCKRLVGKNHETVCDECGKTECSACITTTGFLRKSRKCRECSTPRKKE